MMKMIPGMVVAIALGLVVSACDTGGDAETAAASTASASSAGAPASPNVVTVTTRDFVFQADRTIPAGMTTIRLVNQGPEMHHAQLVRLRDGHTVEDLAKAIEGGPLPEWAIFAGGPNSPAPGETSESTLQLEAGEYALVCLIPSADGVPHVMKGMVAPVTVTAAGASAPAPAADLTMTLRDYSYDLSGDISAGKHTIRVENGAAQPHEVFIVQLAPGKNAGDVLRWIEKPQGPPPGRPIGGTTAMAPGEVNFVTADFEPGEYALYCFVPDAADAQPHVAHGMIRQMTVS